MSIAIYFSKHSMMCNYAVYNLDSTLEVEKLTKLRQNVFKAFFSVPKSPLLKLSTSVCVFNGGKLCH